MYHEFLAVTYNDGEREVLRNQLYHSAKKTKSFSSSGRSVDDDIESIIFPVFLQFYAF